ncbi:hypothetical protein CJ738_36565, partial [Klebsiella pneumoniae]
LIRPQRWWVADDHQQPPAQRERLPDQSLHSWSTISTRLIRPQRWWVADDHQQPPAQRERLPDQSLHSWST